jgi:TonB family protein
MKTSVRSTTLTLALLLLASTSVLAGESPLSSDRAAQLTASIEPVYPYLMRVGGATGEVTVSFTVSATGKVTKAGIKDSDNFELNASALAAIRKWTFTPAIRNGQPVESKLQQTFTFIVSEPAQNTNAVTRIAGAGSR